MLHGVDDAGDVDERISHKRKTDNLILLCLVIKTCSGWDRRTTQCVEGKSNHKCCEGIYGDSHGIVDGDMANMVIPSYCCH